MNQLLELGGYSTAEIADALDGCGVEGALLGMKPLTGGMKLIGPAYTIKYLPYEMTPSAFSPAANYIDSVPANSIIVIDNGEGWIVPSGGKY